MRIERRKPLTATVGIVGVGHHTYWGQFDGLLDELKGKMAQLDKKVQANGVETVTFGILDKAQDAYDAAVTSAQNIIRSCHRAGLDVSDIVLESLASSKAVLTGEEREIGVALVDLGGGTTDLAIFANDSIKHTAVLALGGTNLTNDIAFGLRTPMASAEKPTT